MEKVLIIYMVIWGGYTVWCFWWGFDGGRYFVRHVWLWRVRKEQEKLNAMKELWMNAVSEIDRIEHPFIEWYIEHEIIPHLQMDFEKVLKSMDELVNERVKNIVAENEYWKNTQN